MTTIIIKDSSALIKDCRIHYHQRPTQTVTLYGAGVLFLTKTL